MAHDHDEMRTIIVEAAREVFSRFGYKKTTLDDIASSLYKAKSSIYYYFKSKEDVFRAVIEYEADRAKKIIRNAIDKETSPEAKLRTYFKTIKVFVRETTSYYELMQEDVLEVMSFSRETKAKHQSEAENLISSILNEGIESGDFAVADVKGTAEAVIVAFRGLNNPLDTYEEVTDLQFDNLMNVLLNGLKAR
jgi:AcrR family transcriptional regulator